MFVVIEGIDGSGKTTVAKKLAEEFSKLGRKVYVTYEPTDTKYGMVVKECVDFGDPFMITLAFALDRALHTHEIRKKISEGYDVICDRYFYSTLAYEGAMLSEKMDLDEALNWIEEIHKYIVMEPDHVFLLDVEPRTGLGRIESRKTSSIIKFFEKERFLEKVRNIYLRIAEKYGMKIIDGSKNVDEIIKEIMKEIL